MWDFWSRETEFKTISSQVAKQGLKESCKKSGDTVNKFKTGQQENIKLGLFYVIMTVTDAIIIEIASRYLITSI